MPDTIREAVEGVVKGGATPPADDATHQPAPTEKEAPAREGAAEGLSKQDQQLLASGGLTPEAFDQLPTEVQAAALKAFRSYDRGFHKDREAVAGLKRLKDALEQVPGLEDEVREVVDRRLKGGSPSTLKQAAEAASVRVEKALRGFDRVIKQETNPEVRETLRDTKQVVREELEAVLEDALKDVREEVKALKSMTGMGRKAEAVKAVEALEDERGYPAALIEKYRDQLIAYGAKYPDLDIEDVLFKLVPSAELKAVLSKTSAPKGRETPPKAPPMSGRVAQGEEKELEQFKHRTGGWKLDGLLRHLVAKQGA